MIWVKIMEKERPDLDGLIDKTDRAMKTGDVNVRKLDSYFRDMSLIACRCYGFYPISMHQYKKMLELFIQSIERYYCTPIEKNNVLRKELILESRRKRIPQLIC